MGACSVVSRTRALGVLSLTAVDLSRAWGAAEEEEEVEALAQRDGVERASSADSARARARVALSPVSAVVSSMRSEECSVNYSTVPYNPFLEKEKGK